MQHQRLLRHPGVRALQQAVRREQYRQLVAFSLLLISGLMFVGFAFQQNALITIAGIIFTVLGAAALFHLYKHWNDDRLIHLLRFKPRQVVWVYAIAVQIAPFGIYMFRRGTLFFKLSNGEEMSVSVPTRQLRLISRTLNRLLPHATFGYTREREEQFRKSPMSLLRDEV
ncbi:MAG: hypothetical protein ACK4TA_07490 [Saprospiraceae bacterium]